MRTSISTPLDIMGFGFLMVWILGGGLCYRGFNMINKWRILGNAGVAAFTVLAATIGTGSTEATAINAAIIGASIQGGLAACLELQKEAGEKGHGEKPPKYAPPAAKPSVLVLV